MFIGHFALGLAAKRAAPRTSLTALFAASQLIDLAWPVLILAGVERVRIDPGNTAFTPLDFESYPWTHSLLMVAIWAVAFAVVYRWRTGQARGAAVLGALVLSHWMLDFLTHRPDLPLAPGAVRVGLGLWNSVTATLAVEGALFAAGVAIYAVTTRARNRAGSIALWSLVAFLVLVYAGNVLGSPPPSARAVGAVGLATWLFLPWAAWIDRNRAVVAAALLALAVAPAARAEEERRGPIQDNMFLLEEAYNQEPGVIQHISLYQRDRATGEWVFSFTEEWPARGQAHQVSVTVQVARVDRAPGSATGFGDVALNYRWQAVGSGETEVAVAPRLSAVLPTGEWKQGLGGGGLGLQAALPVSAALGERFVGHFNVGATWLPSLRTAAGDARSVALNVGQGLVWLAHPNLNLLVEAAYTVAETTPGGGPTSVDQTFFLSPGVRGAIDFSFGLQVVLGAALPFGFGPSGGDRRLLLYLSFEHAITDHPW